MYELICPLHFIIQERYIKLPISNPLKKCLFKIIIFYNLGKYIK